MKIKISVRLLPNECNTNIHNYCVIVKNFQKMN